MFSYHHSRPTLRSILLIPAIATFIFSSLPARAYIPALPINDTSGLNLTDSSTIAISWTDPAGVYSGGVSFQLQADVPTGGQTAGALVHFSESTMGQNLTTSTPWIAFISCDLNETTASEEWDIFTLARDRGAVSALLYTIHSTSCLLNPEYITDFEKPLDVFATKTVQVARVIDNQYFHTNNTFDNYNGTLLNISGADVNNSLIGNPPATKNYLIGTLTARNSTGQATATNIPNATPSGSGSGSGNKKTSAPMVVLYTITGVVSTMFILMLVMGGRRAMLHPERYGRRQSDNAQGPQSTAGGLAQAMLDTFPVIKFNRNNRRGGGGINSPPKRLSSENNLEGISLEDRRDSEAEAGITPADRYRRSVRPHDPDGEETLYYGAVAGDRKSSLYDNGGRSRTASTSKASSSALDETRPSTLAHSEPMVTEREAELETEEQDQQCPICLLDFEEGEDLRVLPCEKEHVYHKVCIDPWLLQVASSCPLCRKDFNNPQPLASAPVNPSTPPTPSPPASAIGTSHPVSDQTQAQPPTQHGFAKYLAFMRRERRNRSGSGDDVGEGAQPEGRRRLRSGGRRMTSDNGVGPGRRREADQTGPGGY
ncbi:hypothetical protein CI109_103463 [Kwoniella shandongensis]|uniref:RING-type domain-containing protein n=1 Tax=Kwoniella shandongensis TaxID=1734106 RepID=A0A5M6BW50_9TREE|nr:uncharacterized protein CI109_004634 [Kwoniella shandongensis]KAA5527098.1 hypothetical protein CI109_004634 [Kwoniella shandongensis]